MPTLSLSLWLAGEYMAYANTFLLYIPYTDLDRYFRSSPKREAALLQAVVVEKGWASADFKTSPPQHTTEDPH